MPDQRRPLLAANWKQNLLWQDIEDYCAELREGLPDYFSEEPDPLIDLLVCPPLCYLGLIGALLEQSHIYSGAQLVSTHGGGAFTGEVSAAMVADLGCDYVIVGHSERRKLFGETEEQVGLRLGQAVENDLVPILCIGEDLETRRGGNAVDFTLGQLNAQKERISAMKPGELVIAYEPVWAIGTGENASSEDAQQMASEIRGWLASSLSGGFADSIPILYGGSVKPANISEYYGQIDIDGALVGGASLEAAGMIELLNICLGMPQE